MIYIGIDNGLTGGLVALSQHAGALIDRIEMPTRGKSKGNEVDAVVIGKFLCGLRETGPVTVVMETASKFSKGPMALCSMWDSNGCIRGILEWLEIRHHRITPQAWQRVMLPGCKKGDTKPAALQRARQLWPEETWLRSHRCTKPHDGMIDAALIAEYGRVKKL
jgi:hypothetical protein